MQVDAETAGPPPEPLDSYVVVSKADVVDAIGTFVAAYLVQLPEAEKLKPEELQMAVKHAFKVGKNFVHPRHDHPGGNASVQPLFLDPELSHF